jgi:hypothetical protein
MVLHAPSGSSSEASTSGSIPGASSAVMGLMSVPATGFGSTDLVRTGPKGTPYDYDREPDDPAKTSPSVPTARRADDQDADRIPSVGPAVMGDVDPGGRCARCSSRPAYAQGPDPRLPAMPGEADDSRLLPPALPPGWRPALLQSANLAYKNGYPEKIITACLLHDIGVTVHRGDHGYWGAQLVEPYGTKKSVGRSAITRPCGSPRRIGRDPYPEQYVRRSRGLQARALYRGRLQGSASTSGT